MTHARTYHKRLQQARQKRQQQAKRRRFAKARAHLQREQRRAQRHLPFLEQALVDVGLPETLLREVEWRLKTVGKLLGKSSG